ncbi:MAG: hypothetical protein AAF604_09690 [Acidobacteriota bacterium]
MNTARQASLLLVSGLFAFSLGALADSASAAPQADSFQRTATVRLAGDGERLDAGIRERSGRQELVLWRVTDGTRRRVAAPPGQKAKLRSEPLPIVEDGSLTALAWLEGDRPSAMAVRFAARLGDGWAPVQVVAPPGPGTQIGLAGAALDEGSLLLLWAAFDGQDDEILWSRWSGGTWSDARPLAGDNAVPDITPAVLAVDGGALAAWSRFDGRQYQLVTARFDGRRWSEPMAAAPPGSLYPSFAEGPAGRHLIYRSAAPRGWGSLALDGSGRIVARTVLPSAELARPSIEAPDRWRFPSGTAATIRWEVTP